jgi:hypothetical protein
MGWKLIDAGAVGAVGDEVLLGADGGARVDEAEGLAACIVKRPGLGREVDLLRPWRRSLLVIQRAGHDHQQSTTTATTARRLATTCRPATVARARKGAEVARYWKRISCWRLWMAARLSRIGGATGSSHPVRPASDRRVSVG